MEAGALLVAELEVAMSQGVLLRGVSQPQPSAL